jgi:hypothetical protein
MVSSRPEDSRRRRITGRPAGRGICRSQLEELAVGILYSHRQFSRATVVSFLAMAAILIAVFAPSTTRSAILALPIVTAVVAASVLLAVAVHVVMLSLTVTVSDGELSWYFGPGFWKKRIQRSDITRVRSIRLPWWYGIGIKYTPQASIYLVTPGDGIEIALADGKVVQVGTDDPKGLIAALTRPT